MLSQVARHLARQPSQVLAELAKLLPLLAQDPRHGVVYVHAQLAGALNWRCARFWHAGLVCQGVYAGLHRSHAVVCAHLLFGHMSRKGGGLLLHPSPMVLGVGV